MPTGEVVDRADGRPLAGVVVSDGLVVDAHRATTGRSRSRPGDDAEFVVVHGAVVASGSGRRLVRRRAQRRRRRAPLRAHGAPDAGERMPVRAGDRLHVSVDDGARLRPMIESGVDRTAGVDVTGASGAELRADLEADRRARRGPTSSPRPATSPTTANPRSSRRTGRRSPGVGVPVASVPGNHDHLSCLTREAIDEFFRELGGA